MTIDYPNNRIDRVISAAKIAEMRFMEIAALLEAHENCRDVATLANRLLKIAAETSVHAANDIDSAIGEFTTYVSFLQRLEQEHGKKSEIMPTTDVSEHNVYDYLKQYIKKNISSFSWHDQQAVGAIGNISETGWVQILRHVFDNALETAGFDVPLALHWLRDEDLISTSGRGFTRTKRICGIPRDCVWIYIDEYDETDYKPSDLDLSVGIEVMDHLRKFIRDNLDRFIWYGTEVPNALGRIQSGEVILKRYVFDYALSLGNYDVLATLRYLRSRNLIKCRDRCFTRSRRINGKKEDCICLLIDTRELKNDTP